MFSPAHETKHHPRLRAPFNSHLLTLTQLNDGVSNGTALWLGAQCLSVYLATLRPLPCQIVELGGGIGFTALAMASLGCHVLTTDIPHVIHSVLKNNIDSNIAQFPGSVNVRELDWTVPPDQWTWHDPTAIASASPRESSNSSTTLLTPPFDLVCSADTVYTPSLVEPLLRSLHALCTQSLAASPVARAPPVYLCIERRDPALVDRVLADAHDTWGFTVERIPDRKLAKAMLKAGIKWPKADWEGIEIWKLSLSTG
ncbi:hypothetical protein DXG03_002658 [Asterophora parasitica]|uniref:Methyltransferase-domain-containing protein n=1 Tax=Asterophora parasitica TaxID=117018 RepID=A0A9P7GDF7_9AGAR|nr:hypothetical protein DXG03_002658 [Asterophora parasitica]